MGYFSHPGLGPRPPTFEYLPENQMYTFFQGVECICLLLFCCPIGAALKSQAT